MTEHSDGLRAFGRHARKGKLALWLGLCLAATALTGCGGAGGATETASGGGSSSPFRDSAAPAIEAKAAPANLDAKLEMPPFLPAYYAPALTLDGRPMDLLDHRTAKGQVEYTYTAPQRGLGVKFEYDACQPSLCQQTYDGILRWLDELTTARKGEFTHATQSEAWSTWKRSPRIEGIMIFRLRHAIMGLRYQAVPGKDFTDDYFNRLRMMVNRQRIEEAVAESNVAVGAWAKEGNELYKFLLKDGQTAEALDFLKLLQITVPTDLEAQLALAGMSDDPEVKRNTAAAVYENAEDPLLQERAGALLKTPVPRAADLPPVRRDIGGLQVVLVPLGRADVRLMTDAGALYQRMTGIPTSLARLPQPFDFDRPGRVPDQRNLQNAVVKSQGTDPRRADFTGWDLRRYDAELMKEVAGASPLKRFRTRSQLDALAGRDGQYDAEVYATRLAEALAPLRSPDKKVIYVGVTEADIYFKDSNFVFSTGGVTNGAYVGLLSYGRMTAASQGQRDQSRRRLVERLAKEMVPATLKALDIPRPANPTDPYAYADGLARLDQKHLELSGQTKAAIDRLR